MNRSFDLVIVGAGIVGCMVAYFSRQVLDRRRVLIVDHGFVASGTTGHSPGHCHPQGFDARQRDLTDRSIAFFEAAAPKLPPALFRRKRLFGVVARERAASVVGSYVRGQPRIADADRARQICGSLGLTIDPGQDIHCDGFTFFGQPVAIAHHLAKSFVSEGGSLWEGRHVSGIEEDGSRWRLVLADGQTVSSERVVVSIGPWLSGSALAAPFKEVPFRRKKVCALHVYAELPEDAPLIYFHDDDSYLMPRDDLGYWIFSFASPDWDCALSPASLVIDERDRQIALSVLKKYRDDMVELATGGRLGCDSYAPDFNPGAWPDASGRVVLAGLGSGYGFRLSPAVAADALNLLFPGADVRTERGLE